MRLLVASKYVEGNRFNPVQTNIGIRQIRIEGEQVQYPKLVVSQQKVGCVHIRLSTFHDPSYCYFQRREYSSLLAA